MARFSTRKKMAFSIVATLVVVGGLEGLARLYFWARSGRSVEDAVIDRFHPMRYDLAPGRSLPANGATARINNVGLRGPDAEIPKRRVRILCLGDSATFGYAPDVADATTYPALLQKHLDADHPGKFEVLNGGRPSFSTLDCLGFYSYRASALDPDIVVLMMGWNDTHLACPLVRPREKVVPKLVESSALLKGLGLVLSKFVRKTAPGPAELRGQLERLPKPTDGLSESVFASCERSLEDLTRSVIAHGARPILVRLASPVRPHWSDVDSLTDAEVLVMTPHLIGGEMSPGAWYRFVKRTNEGIDRIGARLGVPVVSGEGLKDPEQFVDVCHPTAKGNNVLARAVAAAVVR